MPGLPATGEFFKLEDDMGKSIFLSKTFWAAAITFGLSVAGLLQGQAWIAENPTAVAVLGMVISAMNVFLRTLTTEPVKIG